MKKILFLAVLFFGLNAHADVRRIYSNVEQQTTYDKSNADAPGFILSKEFYVSSSKVDCYEVHDQFHEVFFNLADLKTITYSGQSLCLPGGNSYMVRLDLLVFSNFDYQNEAVQYYVDKHDNYEFFGHVFQFKKIARMERLGDVAFGDISKTTFPYGTMKVKKNAGPKLRKFGTIRDGSREYNRIRLSFSHDADDAFNSTLAQFVNVGIDKLKSEFLSQVNTVRYRYKEIYYTTDGSTITLHPISDSVSIDRGCHKRPNEKCF